MIGTDIGLALVQFPPVATTMVTSCELVDVGDRKNAFMTKNASQLACGLPLEASESPFQT